jgi:cysteinyl-tRNA synthetase
MVHGEQRELDIQGRKMSLQFYNTLNNRIEEFKEIKKGEVNLYTCGPTVYDYAHIGNFRTFVSQDLMKRYLIYLGYRVNHVMNITDVDDRTIQKSRDLKVPLGQVTGKYIEAFFQDLDTLNVLKADVYPRATEHIGEMLDLIEKLEKNGYIYQKDHSVYFSIEKFREYGRLANISKENLILGKSIDADSYDKDNVQDFVLWKGKKEGEPHWPSKYGDGRPGWHLECSVMSMKYLGPHFDIHGGGVDLIFPHHENEIAQSQCATGEKFVNYWIHAQHLVLDTEKMSKSLGNQINLRDLLKKGYDPMVIRYHLLSTHYRKTLRFSLDGLERSRQSLKRITDFVFMLKGLNAGGGKTVEISALIHDTELKFRENMDHDLNISGALGVFFDFIHQINLMKDNLKKGDIPEIIAFVDRINSVIGVLKKAGPEVLEEDIVEKIALREKARKEKNFQLADSIRDDLKARGIVLIDTPEGVRWKIEAD